MESLTLQHYNESKALLAQNLKMRAQTELLREILTNMALQKLGSKINGKQNEKTNLNQYNICNKNAIPLIYK